MERGESGNILFTRSEFADCVLQPTDFAATLVTVERGLIAVPESVARTLLEDLGKTIDAVNDDDTGEGWVLPKGLKDPALERCVHLRATGLMC